MGLYPKLRFGFRLGYSVILTVIVQAISANAQTSTGIVVESVDDYGGGAQCNNPPNLCNSLANGNGFMQGMVFPGSRWHENALWGNGTVYDIDFVESAIDSQGGDQLNFDIPGTAVSYFTGHGTCNAGCSNTVSCTTTSACTTPNAAAGERMPGSCRFSPLDNPRCCYMTDRQAVTHGSSDKFGGIVNYSSGPIRWGESPQSGGWAGAGTNGGTNLVVLDISCGILPTFWYQALQNANAGVQMIATIMVAGGDTDNVADRGATFATFYRANENARVSDSWLDTMNALPANEGSACPDVGLGAGGGHGFNGCGCNIITGMDSTKDRADTSMNESWVTLANDSNDALGNLWMTVRWQCNYPLRSTDQSAWELP
jgi:hypothetical protein